jgi:hypothetical protein
MASIYCLTLVAYPPPFTSQAFVCERFKESITPTISTSQSDLGQVQGSAKSGYDPITVPINLSRGVSKSSLAGCGKPIPIDEACVQSVAVALVQYAIRVLGSADNVTVVIAVAVPGHNLSTLSSCRDSEASTPGLESPLEPILSQSASRRWFAARRDVPVCSRSLDYVASESVSTIAATVESFAHAASMWMALTFLIGIGAVLWWHFCG